MRYRSCPRFLVSLLHLLLLTLPWGLATAQAPALPVSSPSAEAFEGQVTLKVGYRYLLSLPDDYLEDLTKKWPLLVFLHGAGERGNDLKMLLKHGPPKLISGGKKFPAIVASPQVDSGAVWNPHGVKALVDELKRKYRVDEARVYLTGISMGGFGTWDALFEYPDVFAAAVPVCGGAGVKFVMAERIKHVPIWIFHGGSDPVVEPSFSTRIHQALIKAGDTQVKLTMYPGVAHDSWTATYENLAMWDWLFQQKLTSR